MLYGLSTPALPAGHRTLLRLAPHALPRHVLRLLHRSEVNARQIFTRNPEGEKLSAGKDGDDGCQEGETRHHTAAEQETANDVPQHSDAEKREREPDEACH